MTGRDPVVSRALARMPVPDHGPEFWTRLEAELARVDATAGAPLHDVALDHDGVLADVAELSRTRRAGRSGPGRNRFLAAAAVVAVLGASVALVARGGGEGELTTAPADTAPGGDTTTSMSPAGAADGTEAQSFGAATATDAVGVVTSFLDALGADDAAAAAALLGPLTEQYLDTQGGVEAWIVDGAGLEGWAASPDRTVSTQVVGDETVVLIAGTYTDAVDGTRYRVDAIPVRFGASVEQVWVEPAAFDPAVGGRLADLVPAADADGTRVLAPGAEVSVSAPAGEVAFSLAGSPAATVTVQGGVARWTPDALPGRARSTLIAVWTDDAGHVSALAAELAVG